MQPSFQTYAQRGPNFAARAGAEPAQQSNLRAEVCGKLGLPSDATNAQIFATVDRAAAIAAQRESEDSLYDLAFGRSTSAPPPADALYDKAWGNS